MAEEEQMTDDEALMKIAKAMGKNAPSLEEKQSIHTFLFNVVQEEKTEKIIKIGNLKDGTDKIGIDELGIPRWTTRGCLEMARISEKIMGNDFFKEYFLEATKETVSSSLSREGFLIRSATTQTKQVADITKRRKINKGMFGTKKIEETGGDTISS